VSVEIFEGAHLVYITSHEDVPCVVIADETIVDDNGRTYAKVCFFAMGGGYDQGDIDWVAVDDLREGNR
jgi:hypothetical protein